MQTVNLVQYSTYVYAEKYVTLIFLPNQNNLTNILFQHFLIFISNTYLTFVQLQGSLPFDHQDMSKLLERVRTGKYSMPSWMPAEARSLIQQMLQVAPEKRISVRFTRKLENSHTFFFLKFRFIE